MREPAVPVWILIFVSMLFGIAVAPQYVRGQIGPSPSASGCSLSGCTFTGPILLPNGSAAVPAVAFSGDAATGIYRAGATTLAISVGGADRMDYNISYGNGWAFGGNGGTQALGGFKSSASTSFGAGADVALSWQGTGFVTANNVGLFAWASSSAATAGVDTGLSRDAAGVVDAGNGTQGDKTGRMQMAGILTAPTTVGALPTCNAANEGLRQYVTDQNTAVSYRGAVTGSGTTRQAVLCSNLAWVQD